MIVLDVQQGSPEWQMARLGIPTASKFDKIITAEKMEFSKSAEKYALALLAEQILQQPVEGGSWSNTYAERGQVVEEKARSFYELRKELDGDPVTVKRVGFCMSDDRRFGCSPDGLVVETGLLEIKCPKPDTHLGYLLDGQGIGYKAQVQGQLYTTGREWVDTLSYHPDLPPALVRRHRDEKFIAALEVHLKRFFVMMDEMKLKLIADGHFEKGTFGSIPSLKIA